MKFHNSPFANIEFSQEVPYISFPPLTEIPFIRHGFSTKLGGVSSGMFESMNLGAEALTYQDDIDLVHENFRRISKQIGIDPQSIVISKQVHKSNIRVVDANDKGKGLYRERDFDEIDGLITNIPGVTLVTKYADCVPLYFVDRKKKAIGLSHSGWRGTVLKIGKTTVEEMVKAYGSNPRDIIAVIGPSICEKCYEVGGELIQAFEKAFPSDFNKIITQNEDGSYQCNLWMACEITLKEAGLIEGNIYQSGVCTSCHSDLLFSHRKTAGKRGSLAALLSIEKE